MYLFTENANAPELVIKPPQPLLDFQYNPRDRDILVGGMVNGQVIKIITNGYYRIPKLD